MAAEKEELYLVILGDGGVGKSAITIQFCQKRFQDHYDPTIEDTYRKEITVQCGKKDKETKTFDLEILDSAGQEEFKGMRDIYYKKGEGFVLVFSVGVTSSLSLVTEHYEDIKTCTGLKGSELPPFMIVGNKCDLPWQAEAPAGMAEFRVVTEEEGRKLAETLSKDGAKASYIETSAKSNINIDELFRDMTKEMYASKIARNKALKKKSGSCDIL